MTMSAHPIQPLVNKDGVTRFKENSIIIYLFDAGRLDLNELAKHKFPAECRQQLAQLLGYSLDGYRGLSYVTKAAHEAAQAGESVVQSPTLALCDLAKPYLIDGQRLFASKSIVVAINDSQPLTDRLADINLTVRLLTTLGEQLAKDAQ